MNTVSPARVALLLRSAVDLMNDGGRHWVKGNMKVEMKNDEWGYCSAGAIRNVEGFTQNERDRAEQELAELIRESESYWLDEYLCENYGEDVILTDKDTIFEANDNEETTWKMVRGWFIAAANRVKTA